MWNNHICCLSSSNIAPVLIFVKVLCDAADFLYLACKNMYCSCFPMNFSSFLIPRNLLFHTVIFFIIYSPLIGHALVLHAMLSWLEIFIVSKNLLLTLFSPVRMVQYKLHPAVLGCDWWIDGKNLVCVLQYCITY